MDDSMKNNLNNDNIEDIDEEVAVVRDKSYGELSHKDRRDMLLERIDSMDPDDEFDLYEPIRKKAEVKNEKTSLFRSILKIFGM